MTWNYRVIKDTNGCLGIHEVYYDKKGRIKAWSVDPIEPYGETFEDLKSDLDYMNKALEKEILAIEQLEKDHACKKG